jgi:Flp pilus assembly protein TadG
MRVNRPLRPWRAALGRLRGRPEGESGQAIVEFAFVAPAFIGLLAAIMEFSGIMFVQAMLEGSAREASRYGLTGFTSGGVSREDQILAIVQEHTHGIIDMADLEMETLVYENFGDIGQPEPFTDQNANEVWDNDEPFTDINGNGTWDPDMGAAGLGGPGAVVVYRMSYDWNIMIPIFRPFFGDTITLQSNIAVRNEPFDTPPPEA